MIIFVYATYSEIYGRHVTSDHFIDILKLFNRTFLLNILIKLDAIFHQIGYQSQKRQQFFIRSFFLPQDQKRVFRKTQELAGGSGHVLVFSRQQTHNLIKLAILHCEDSTQQDLSLANEHIGSLFLMMNDFYDSIVDKIGRSKGTVEYIIRNSLYNSTEEFRKTLCRFHDLFIEIPKGFPWHATQNWEKEFESITNLTIEELMALGFSFLAHWNQLNFANLKIFNPFLNKDTYFRHSVLTQEKRDSAFDIFCENIDQCRDKIQRQVEGSTNWQLEFDAQRNRPLFEMPEVGIGTHGQSFLIDKITDNVYWTLLDNLPSPRKDQFLQAFGEVFEAYIVQILRRIFRNKVHKISYDGKEAGDCIVEIRKHLFVFEVKSGRLIKKVHMTGSRQVLYDELRRKLVLRQLKQISKVVDDFRAKKFPVGEIAYDETRKIFPVCITLQEIPQLPPVREELENIVSQENLLKDPKIQPFQIMDAEEVEILESMLTKKYAPSQFLDFMQHKCGNHDFRSQSFKNFVYQTTAFFSSPQESDKIKTTFHSLADKFSEVLFRKGINETSH